MNGHPERSILRQTRDEGCQNGELAEIALNGVVRTRTVDGRIEEVGRFDVLGDEALSFELLDGSLGALGKEQDVPVFVAHPGKGVLHE